MPTAALVLALLTAAPTPPPSQRHMTVAGDARVAYRPNRVQLSFVVSAPHRDAAAALKASEEKARKLQDACRKTGVDFQVLQSAPGGPSPEYRGNEVVSYTATRTLVLMISDLARVDEVLTAASKAGGTAYGAPVFSHTDQRTFETKARIAAAASARERAVGMIEALGGKVGLPASMSEVAPHLEFASPGPMFPGPDGVVTTNWASLELAVVATVSVQFDIEAP